MFHFCFFSFFWHIPGINNIMQHLKAGHFTPDNRLRLQTKSNERGQKARTDNPTDRQTSPAREQPAKR